jgi:hypothetical protein
MKGVGEWIVVGIIAAILAVIIFVRAGQLSGESGGTQASSIINSTTAGVGGIINAAEGMGVANASGTLPSNK